MTMQFKYQKSMVHGYVSTYSDYHPPRKEPHMLTVEQVENIRNAHAGEGGIKSWNVDDINALCDLALTALTTPISGWKLVPIEPTEEILEAMVQEYTGGKTREEYIDWAKEDKWDSYIDTMRPLYKAAVDASPTVEVEG